jgi:hypothetical protein
MSLLSSELKGVDLYRVIQSSGAILKEIVGDIIRFSIFVRRFRVTTLYVELVQ